MLLAFILGLSVNQAAADEEYEFVSGVVQSISVEEIVVKQTDAEDEADEGREITFVINDQTGLENVAALEEIVNGDEVFIDFEVQGGNYIAVNIYKVGLDEEFAVDFGSLQGMELTDEEQYTFEEYEEFQEEGEMLEVEVDDLEYSNSAVE